MRWRIPVALTLTLLAVGAGGVAAQGAAQHPVKEARPGLARLAKVSADTATAIALRAVPGSAVQSAELEEEEGRLVYSFDLVVAGRSGVEEVLVDAGSGRVISRKHESAAAEAAEHRREATPRP